MSETVTIEHIQRTCRPVFVIAPTARNGITLLQRLVNSTGQIIVYGENAIFMHELVTVAIQAIEVNQQQHAEFEQVRTRFLQGERDGWTSNLWPDSNRFANAVIGGFYQTTMVYEQCTREYGCGRWGIKYPLTDPYIVPRLLCLLPGSRFVFIHRHLFDVVRSAKARQFITNDEQLIEYGRQYQANMHAVLNTPREQMMIIRYEDLMADPEPVLKRLETFTGVSGIDRSVLSRRINTFQGDPSIGRSPTGYIPPAELTEAEKALLTEEARPTLEQAGYR